MPAYFDEVRRKATQDAGYIAGLDVIDIINEPTAAAVAFGFQQGFLNADGEAGEPQKILVYDLGGGTFDVTVMEIGGRDFTALATDGDVLLGGTDWDQRLVDLVAEEFIRKHGIDPREDAQRRRPPVARVRRRQAHALGPHQGRRSPATIKGHAVADRNHAASSSRSMTHDLLDRTAFTTRQTLQAAGLEWNDIDRVLLVGGSTPHAGGRARCCSELSGKEPDCSVSPDEAVAHGAALHAGLICWPSTQGKPPRSTSATSTRTAWASWRPTRKTGRPAQRDPHSPQHAAAGRRPSARLQDAEGQARSRSWCRSSKAKAPRPTTARSSANASVRDLPPNLPAQTPIEVRFRYEENGRLTVKVRVEGTDAELEHEITRENSLTQEQLDLWRDHIRKTTAGT